MTARWWVFVFLLCVGSSAHAAGFDCKKASTQTEKIICGNIPLSDLDSKLADVYAKTYEASNPAAKAKLRVGQRIWLGFVNGICGDAECITVAYQARIDQLEGVEKNIDVEGPTDKRGALEFEGLRLGQMLDDKKARKVISGFSCRPDKLMSSIEHERVVSCSGRANFEKQEMDAILDLHGNHELASVFLCYDTPYPEEGVVSTSVSEMENRLIATYGQPEILRTESAHQPIKYGPKDLIGMPGSSEQYDYGGDQWVFANGASIILETCAGHQKVEGGHIFSGEAISFNSDARMGVSVTLPGHHPIPIVLTQLFYEPKQELPWKLNELVAVQLFAGGKRMCYVTPPTSSASADMGARYIATMTCTDFVEIGYSVEGPRVPTRVQIFKDGKKLAIGYIPASKAISSLEQR
jgi:uncharacterized protein